MNQFGIFAKTIMYCASQNKKKFLLSLLSSIIYATISISVSYTIQLVLEKCLGASAEQCVLWVTLLGITILLSQCSMTINNYFFDVFYYEIKKSLQELLHRKVETIRAEEFEESNMLDMLTKAKNGIDGYLSIYSLLHMLLFFYVPFFVGMEVYLYRLHPNLSWIVIVVFVPELVAQILKVRSYNALENSIIQETRMQQILEESIISREYYKSSKVYDACSLLFSKLDLNMNILGKKRMKTEMHSATIECVFKLITTSGQISALAILVTSVLGGYISIGAFAAVFEAILLITAYLDEIICVHFDGVSRKTGLVNNFNLFIQRNETHREPAMFSGDEIVLSNVSYHYPMSKTEILCDISMKIKKGETVAIVGYNGAGKTTLSKILLGLLQPTSGTVCYGNTFLQDRQLSCTALFQNYQKYKLSLKKNVSIANHLICEEERIAKLLAKVQVDPTVLPGKTETILAPEFGGIDISGGKWQRIALARALYAQYQFIVLDEPTASIDPLEESKLYNSIATIAKDTTMLLITHRIGVAQIADRIIVLEKGKIVEDGTHEELMKNKALYYKMFFEQAKWYN